MFSAECGLRVFILVSTKGRICWKSLKCQNLSNSTSEYLDILKFIVTSGPIVQFWCREW